MNQSEFKEIFQLHFKEIKRFVFYKSGDEGLSEDIAQEVFIKVWENRLQVKLESVKPLLYKIASNLFINQHKRKQVEFKFQNSLFRQVNIESPQYLAEMKEFHQKYQRALDEMNDKHRTVFLMNRIDGLKYHEIAAILELSQKAIEKRMKHALSYMVEKLNHKV